MSRLFYDALYKKYEADIANAKASIHVYMTSAVGIGEHPQHVEELDKLLDQHASAKDKLDSLSSLYTEGGVAKGVNKE